LEILPAVCAWSAISLPIALSFYYPLYVGIFILVFSSIWFFKSLEFMGFLIYSYYKYKKSQKINWNKLLDDIDNHNIADLEEQYKLEKMLKKGSFISPNNLRHLVIVATYKEDYHILEQTIKSVLDTDYDKKKLYICIATEERAGNHGINNAKKLKEQYGDQFGEFVYTVHSDGIEGEVIGKGGNITHAGRELEKMLQERGIKKSEYKNYIVTTLDADNCVDKAFFACLTYTYSMEDQRKYRSFQPLSFFFNNIWEVPIFNRLVSLSSGFWHMIENGRPDRLRNFAAHSQPFEALAEMDFWATDTIVEDGHQFWRSYLHFKGNYAVCPFFVPVYQDAMQDATFFKSIKGQFLQLRRWAWGVTDVLFMIKNWWKMRRELPFTKTLLRFWRLAEGHFMWATAPILITLTTPVPSLINEEFNKTVFAANSSFLISNFFKIALFGIIISMSLSMLTMPKAPTFRDKISLFWQWILLPPMTIVFGAFPAITAQTILAFGKKLEFKVTPKFRKSHEKSSNHNKA
jgi:cellulose synthase/poly-beta-1,6-N-acetylglucosamine synthase-like glycosyltransferase